MSLSMKPGVRILGIRPELLLGLRIAEGAYEQAGCECVITCVIDGKHSRASLHYAGCAADIRINNVPKDKLAALKETIAARLGPDFDLVLETDHFHLEYQPKNYYGD